MAKLNKKRNELWQKPKVNVQGPETEWFVNQVLGKDTLNNAMKSLSLAAGLSKTYTNHCIRATVVTVMDDNNCPTRHIQATTGHKSEASIKSYAKKISAKKRREICELLQNQVQPQPAENIPQDVPGNNVNTVPQNVMPQHIAPPLPENNFIPGPQDFWPENAELQQLQELNDGNLVQVLADIEQENANMGIAPQQPVPVAIQEEPNVVGQQIQPLEMAPPQPQMQIEKNPLQQVHFSSINNVSNIQPANPMPPMYISNSTVNIHYHYGK